MERYLIDHDNPSGETFAQLLNSMKRDKDLTAHDWRVMLALHSKTANWRVSATYVANEIESVRRSVIRSLNHLIELGYAQPIYGKSGRDRVDYKVASYRKFSNSVNADTVSTVTQVETLVSTVTLNSVNPDTGGVSTLTQGCVNPDTPTVSNLTPYEELNEELTTKNKLRRESYEEGEAPQQSERQLTSVVKLQWDTVPRSAYESSPSPKTEPGTFKTSSGKTSFTDDDIGDLAHARMAKEFERGINLDGPPAPRSKPISGLIQASNVHLYRKAN